MAENRTEWLQLIEEHLDQLEVSLSALRHELGQEVITRRVTVVDDHGVARVILSAEDETGSVVVRADRPNGETTGAELYAMDGEDGDVHVGLDVIRDGDGSAVFRDIGDV